MRADFKSGVDEKLLEGCIFHAERTWQKELSLLERRKLVHHAIRGFNPVVIPQMPGYNFTAVN